MGFKTVTFDTQRSVRDCEVQFRSGITSGRGASARIGGLYAKMLGGESLTWSPPDEVLGFLRNNPELVDMHGDPPATAWGVSVPKAMSAHMHGTSIIMCVWDRGGHREVRLLADHSLTGGTHAQQLLDVARTAMA
ncbi:MAG: hypothetical protein QOJ29_2244 [Thermoleophilaceae bacterium]|jgi:hypothetical protein|nr:hypothetical protein [Thermoleophilaceae bacterium]